LKATSSHPETHKHWTKSSTYQAQRALSTHVIFQGSEELEDFQNHSVMLPSWAAGCIFPDKQAKKTNHMTVSQASREEINKEINKQQKDSWIWMFGCLGKTRVL
jgi:hypothetical protein